MDMVGPPRPWDFAARTIRRRITQFECLNLSENVSRAWVAPGNNGNLFRKARRQRWGSAEKAAKSSCT